MIFVRHEQNIIESHFGVRDEGQKKGVKMNEATQKAYLKLAAHFYANKLGDKMPTLSRITNALMKSAPIYRPAYWRKLRNAISFEQQQQGFVDSAKKINLIENPITKAGLKVKAKQKRVKSTNSDDLKVLSNAVKSKCDAELNAALGIVHRLGCRPSELISIKCLSENQIYIKGSKKTEKLNRGADRYISVDEKDFQFIKSQVEVLKKAEKDKVGVIKRCQSRLDRLTKKIWPRRNHRINFYSFRHQTGSTLKSSGLSRVEIAYIMGHQSTQSVEVYGNRRNGGKNRLSVGNKADLSNVRENHKALNISKNRQIYTTLKL